MKKAILSLLLVMGLVMFPQVVMALTFTMDTTQLQSLYETYENPDHAGTFLNPVSVVPGGAKYTGNIGSGIAASGGNPAVAALNGWGTLQIGANFWGHQYPSPDVSPAGLMSRIGALGMGDATGYNKYALIFENVNENAWEYNLYFNVGYTDLGETNYYVENTWTTIPAAGTAQLVLDLTNARVWGGGYSGAWLDVTGSIAQTGETEPDWTHLSNIGFNIGANVPLGAASNDWTFETIVRPVPEPSSMLLLGLGLIGFAGRIRKRFRA